MSKVDANRNARPIPREAASALEPSLSSAPEAALPVDRFSAPSLSADPSNAVVAEGTGPNPTVRPSALWDRKANVSPSTEWKEVYRGGCPEKEREQHQAWAREHAAIQTAMGQKLGKMVRGQHSSPMGVAKVRFEVLDNIPEFAKHGIFSKPGVLTGLVRFSHASPRVDDTIPGFPGLALALEAKDGQRQDFLTTTMDSFLKDPHEVMALVRGGAASAGLPPDQASAKLFEVMAQTLGPERAQFLLGRMREQLKRPVQSLANETFASSMPIKVGPYVAKFAMRPVAPDGKSWASGNHYLKDDLKARLAKGPVSFEFGLQFYENEQKTPLEDMTDVWDAPYIPVARLTIPKQNLDSEDAKQLQADIEKRALTPWNTEGHEPVGEIGRARKEIYGKSAETRGACPFLSGQLGGGQPGASSDSKTDAAESAAS